MQHILVVQRTNIVYDNLCARLVHPNRVQYAQEHSNVTPPTAQKYSSRIQETKFPRA